MKKVPKIILLVVIIIVAMSIADYTGFFDPKQRQDGGRVYEKPPKDPAEKKEWIADKIFKGTFNNEFAYLDYQVPSKKELEKIKKSTSLERVYPQKMNTLLEYGSTMNMANLIYFGDELKDLGINTYVVSVSYHLVDGQIKYFYTDFNDPNLLDDNQVERAIAHAILMAKQHGFTVVLFADIPELEDGGLNKLKNPDDLENMLEEVVLNLAGIAEEYQTEYIITDPQMAMILMTNDYPLAEAAQRTNAYRTQIIPKIKQLYSGKIMYKTSGLDKWENMKQLSMVGADIFGFTGCYANDPAYISNDIKKMAQVADEISKRDGVPWMNIEFVIRGKEDQLRDFGEIRTSEPVENYYKAGLDSFKKNATTAKGFTVLGWLGMGKIRGTKAVPLVKDFFQTY